MGGNRFPDESYAAYIRRVLMQVPYYVPPVVIANLVRKNERILLLLKVRLPFYHWPTGQTLKLNQCECVKTFKNVLGSINTVALFCGLSSSCVEKLSSQHNCMKFQINLMLFIFLLGAVEIVPLFLGHITGKQYPIMSHLQPPIGGGGGGGGAAGDAEGSPSGQGAEPGSVEGSTARASEIERLKEVKERKVISFLFHSFIRFDCDFSSRGRYSPMRHPMRCRCHRPLSLRIPPKSRVSRGTPLSTTSSEHCRLLWPRLETLYW